MGKVTHGLRTLSSAGLNAFLRIDVNMSGSITLGGMEKQTTSVFCLTPQSISK